MSSILVKGVIRNGRVEVDGPLDLPEGMPVFITDCDVASEVDDEPSLSATEIAATLAAMDLVEPFDLTDGERRSDDL